MVRYPLGGNLSWAMQWLSGFKRLGHDVVMAERAGYPRSCFHPLQQVYDDDSDFGCGIVSDLLARIGMEHDWYFEDATGEYHGKSRSAAEAAIPGHSTRRRKVLAAVWRCDTTTASSTRRDGDDGHGSGGGGFMGLKAPEEMAPLLQPPL